MASHNGMRRQSFMRRLMRINEVSDTKAVQYYSMLSGIPYKELKSTEQLLKLTRSIGVIESTKKITLGNIEFGVAYIPALLMLADLEIHSDGDNDNLHSASLWFDCYVRDYTDNFNEAETEHDRITLAIMVFMTKFSKGQSWKEDDKFAEVLTQFPFEKLLGKLTFHAKIPPPKLKKST